jgi:hypothetical protein
MRKIIWGIKQLLPLTYRSHFTRGKKKIFSVWRMWFGKVFDHEEVECV